MVADAVRWRIVLTTLGVAPVLWFSLVARLPSDGSMSVAEAVRDASVLVGAMLIGACIVAWRWRRRIAAEPYVIREHGVFRRGGSLKAWWFGDKNERWIGAAIGHLRLDKDDHDQALQIVWAAIGDPHWPEILELDYTPHRYLLAVRDGGGQLLFARSGYRPPPADASARPLTPGEIRSLSDGWPRALRPLALAVACAIGGITVLVLGAGSGILAEASGLTMTVIVLEIGLFAVILYLLGLGLVRMFSLVAESFARTTLREIR